MRWIIRYYILIALLIAGPLYLRAQEVRSVPDSVVEKMKRDRDFLYANDPSYWQQEKIDSDNTERAVRLVSNPVMKLVLYALLGLVIIFILYQVAVVNNFFIFSGRKRKKGLEGEGIEEELTPDNIDMKISQAIASKEYRMAIRYLYLKTLNILNEKDRIKLHAQSTNNDYLNQMRKFPGFGEFASLTRVYEYVWYGEFQPGEQQFEKIHNNFHQFIARN